MVGHEETQRPTAVTAETKLPVAAPKKTNRPKPTSWPVKHPADLEPNSLWLSESTMRKFLMDQIERKELDAETKKQLRRRGVFVRKPEEEDEDLYPQQEEDEWGSFLNIVRSVCAEGDDCLTSQEEATVTKRVQSRLKLENRFGDWKCYNDFDEEKLDYLHDIIDEEILYLDQSNRRRGIEACRSANEAVVNARLESGRLREEIQELEKSVKNGDSAAEERIRELEIEWLHVKDRWDASIAQMTEAVVDLDELCQRRPGVRVSFNPRV